MPEAAGFQDIGMNSPEASVSGWLRRDLPTIGLVSRRSVKAPRRRESRGGPAGRGHGTTVAFDPNRARGEAFVAVGAVTALARGLSRLCLAQDAGKPILDECRAKPMFIQTEPPPIPPR